MVFFSIPHLILKRERYSVESEALNPDSAENEAITWQLCHSGHQLNGRLSFFFLFFFFFYRGTVIKSDSS
jgi:hypothetical protein